MRVGEEDEEGVRSGGEAGEVAVRRGGLQRRRGPRRWRPVMDRRGGRAARSMGLIPPIQSGGQREERGVGRGSGASGVGFRSRVSGGWGDKGDWGGPAWVGWFGGQLGRSAQLARGVSSFFCYFFLFYLLFISLLF